MLHCALCHHSLCWGVWQNPENFAISSSYSSDRGEKETLICCFWILVSSDFLSVRFPLFFVQLLFSYPVDFFSGCMLFIIQVVRLSCQYTRKISINLPGHYSFSPKFGFPCVFIGSFIIRVDSSTYFLPSCLGFPTSSSDHVHMYNRSFALRFLAFALSASVSCPCRDQGLHWLKYLSVFCVNKQKFVMKKQKLEPNADSKRFLW